MRIFFARRSADITGWEAELGVNLLLCINTKWSGDVGGFFFPFNAEKMVHAEEREKTQRRSERMFDCVWLVCSIFRLAWNCPADSNLIRHPQIKHGSSSSKQKRSNTALPNKQSALYFHLFLSFIYFLFFLFFSCLAISNGNRLAGRYVKAKEMSEF